MRRCSIQFHLHSAKSLQQSLNGTLYCKADLTITHTEKNPTIEGRQDKSHAVEERGLGLELVGESTVEPVKFGGPSRKVIPQDSEPISDCPRRFPRSLYFIIMQAGIIERLCVELR